MASRCQKGHDGRKPFERLHGKTPSEEFFFGEKVLAKNILQIRNLAWHEKNDVAEFFIGAGSSGSLRGGATEQMRHRDQHS